jgi:hypothetical protein
LGGVVEDAIFDALKHHAVCSLDLAVAARVCHRGVVDVDEAILVEIPDPKKVVPRLVTILLGTPKWWMMCSMNFSTSFNVTVVMAWTLFHLMNLSTAARVCLQPPGAIL